MKRFEFSLERVRVWRDEQAALQELKLHDILAELNALETERGRTEEELRSAEWAIRGQPVVEAGELATLDAFREHTRIRLRDNADQRRLCEQRVRDQRQRVIEARRQFELLDRLQKKALFEWKAAREKEQEELAAELFLGKRQRDRI
jgi:hypothetical protein